MLRYFLIIFFLFRLIMMNFMIVYGNIIYMGVPYAQLFRCNLSAPNKQAKAMKYNNSEIDKNPKINYY